MQTSRRSTIVTLAALPALSLGCPRRDGAGDEVSGPCKVPQKVSDSFDGSGPLQGYRTTNPTALPKVARVDGRYRAEVTNNDNDVTLHYMEAQGRLDAKEVCFPFEFIARNIGIGTLADSQVAPAHKADPFIFAGVQVHATELEEANSSHVVVGHRGHIGFTVEGKNTFEGFSEVDDVGAGAVPQGRADLRILGSADRTLTVYWQRPNLEPRAKQDQWRPYNHTGRLPGRAPKYGRTVYIGLITYAYRQAGLPFVGTCDSVELVGH